MIFTHSMICFLLTGWVSPLHQCLSMTLHEGLDGPGGDQLSKKRKEQWIWKTVRPAFLEFQFKSSIVIQLKIIDISVRRCSCSRGTPGTGGWGLVGDVETGSANTCHKPHPPSSISAATAIRDYTNRRGRGVGAYFPLLIKSIVKSFGFECGMIYYIVSCIFPKCILKVCLQKCNSEKYFCQKCFFSRRISFKSIIFNKLTHYFPNSKSVFFNCHLYYFGSKYFVAQS